jgi:hypothetical protein
VSEVRELRSSKWSIIKLKARMDFRYPVFWGIIKDDLLRLFSDLHREALDLYSLNFEIITLIPKTQNAIKIQPDQFVSLMLALRSS